MKSLRLCLLATASSAALVGSAAAADMSLPVKAPPPAVWSWTGPYIGVNAGAIWRNTTFTNPTAFGTIIADPIFTENPASFIGGVQVGYNWQSGAMVYGVEADFDWVNGKSTAATSGGSTSTSNLNWMSTVRGRGGILVTPQMLAYLTGGVAFAQFSDSWGFPGLGFNDSSVRIGWTAGGGLEYMLTPRWTVRVEGLYADFGSKAETTLDIGGPYSSTFKHSVAVARAALNWKW